MARVKPVVRCMQKRGRAGHGAWGGGQVATAGACMHAQQDNQLLHSQQETSSCDRTMCTYSEWPAPLRYLLHCQHNRETPTTALADVVVVLACQLA